MAANGKTLMVEAPGARLYTESAGSGPALVLISGGGGDAAMYEQVTGSLAEHYTVLTFDRRGNSRSPLTARDADIDVATQAADVVAILDAYGIDRALVFGNSGGAIIALELIAHHGKRVRAAVVHEPPLVQLLAAEDPARQEITRIHRLALDKSPMRGFAAFGAMTAPHLPAPLRSSAGQTALAVGSTAAVAAASVVHRITGRPVSPMTRMLGNTDLLMRREIPAFCFDYRPAIAALRTTSVPWRPAVGRDSAGRPYFVTTEALAARLGIECAEFSGGHTAYQTRPEDFVRQLTQTFTELDR
ncbi:alpha/beta hydrolase family protein [Nocardia nova SH22a]|uniref:Alpha/beta hydrolase family protein n=1 Tax=Nocardia nova SH22a TaxID=1415166 RepID=W5TBQ9_9NOCA|nr:alpha/beta hydrolase family protein [Nocardia nova SH22a]